MFSLLNSAGDDFFEIEELLENEHTHCYDIGSKLKLYQHALDKIKLEAGTDYGAAMRKIITSWLKRNYDTRNFGPPTWRALEKAVRAPGGGNNAALADKIAELHPASATPGMYLQWGLSQLIKYNYSHYVIITLTGCNVATN